LGIGTVRRIGEITMKNNTSERLSTNLDELRSIFLNHSGHRFDEHSLMKIHRALEVAEEAHEGQTRDDGTAYILHPLRIALSLMQELNVYDEELICAALLHDAIEDQEQFTLDDMEDKFGIRISSIVRILTKPDKIGKKREEINKIYFERLERSDDDCKLVKLADKLDNVRDAVNCPDPKKRQRTAKDAKDFYLSLIGSLRDDSLRQILLNQLKQAIDILETTTAPT
jgi:GTP diphosphokinase / guanosine-3',5'-bis(diphosphate) 3'-diphosphatase